MPDPESLAHIWPHSQEEVSSFIFRRKVFGKMPQDLGGGQLWVAKDCALPQGWQLFPSTVLWAAGLVTWKKLARRGYWVHGCSEGLGEGEDERLSTLLGSEPRWIKLTHRERPSPRTGTLEPVRSLEPMSWCPAPSRRIFSGERPMSIGRVGLHLIFFAPPSPKSLSTPVVPGKPIDTSWTRAWRSIPF